MELINNSCFQIVGPSGSGKTHFVCKLLQNQDLFQRKFKNIYWHYGADGESGLTARELCKLKGVKYVKGFDDNWKKRAMQGDVIIIDDLYQESNWRQISIIYSLKSADM